MRRLGFRRNATFVVVRANLPNLELGQELTASSTGRARLRRWYRRRMIGTLGDEWTDTRLEVARLEAEEPTAVIEEESPLEEVELDESEPQVQEAEEPTKKPKRKISLGGLTGGQRVQ